MALLIEGRVVQHAPPRDVFERPASPVVARFFGATTLVPGTVTAGRLRRDGIDLPVPGPDRVATVALRPEHLRLGTTPSPTDGSLAGVVREVDYQGGHHRLVVDVDGLPVVAHVTVTEPPVRDDPIRLVVPAEHVWALPEHNDRTEAP